MRFRIEYVQNIIEKDKSNWGGKGSGKDGSDASAHNHLALLMQNAA